MYNKFRSAISYKPTVATVLTPEAIDKQLAEPSGNKLDAYEIEATHERSDVLQDLAEFQLAAVRLGELGSGVGEALRMGDGRLRGSADKGGLTFG